MKRLTQQKSLLLNIRSVRVFARETSFEQLLEMQEKLNAVIEERREEAEREAAERAERERKRQELLPVDCRRRFFTGRTAWPVRRWRKKTRKKDVAKSAA
uniref:Global DNA-binding transcriptional dual regulator H-NS n=1 Tax=Escherichia coli TaxID=562 RepID=A0A1W5T7Z6_ECOLX|nr:global DNA-binding transcriptional dual regulator H-NS [Escherichia coli]